MSHTKEPWHTRIGRFGNGIASSQHEQICNADGRAVMMVEHDGSVEGSTNVVRVLVCVNACSGLKDPEKDIRDLVMITSNLLRWWKGRSEGFRKRANPYLFDNLESALAKFEGVK